jgi:hypothetical protein
MRKLFIVSLLFTLIANITFLDVHGASNDLVNFEITESLNYYYEDENTVVFGNYNDIDKLTIDYYILLNKNVFIYDYYLDDNLNNNLASTNSAVLYSNHDMKQVDILNLQSIDFTDFETEVMAFYYEKIMVSSNDIESKSIDTSVFQPFYQGSFRELKAPYGYVDVIYTVKKYRSSSTSSLYLVESKVSFTPGKMARDNGDNNYGNWYNKSGYFHVEAQQAVNEIDQATIRKGGTPKLKDAYPENSPGMITVSSTYSIGATLGYSFTNGFSLDNITMEQNREMGLNISYGYTKAYSNQEPALSTQISSSNLNVYQWTYTYVDERNETNHINTGYLFEMNNYNHNLFEGDLSLKYNYKMTVIDDGWWIFKETESFTGQKLIGYY